MKFELNWGDSWRATFKKLLWFSVIVFEGATILLSILISNLLGFFKFFSDSDSQTLLIVIFIVVGTAFNFIVHSLWGCLAYMFEDIARTRAVTCALAEYTIEKDKLLHPEVVDALDGKATPKSTLKSNSAAEKKVYRSVADRSASDNKKPQETWECPECGTLNPTTSTFCKDCGNYK